MMKRFTMILAVLFAAAVFMPMANAQLLGEFTLTSAGVSTNAVIEDPGSSTADFATVSGELELYLSAIAVVDGKGTGNVTWIFAASPDNVTWTSTNATEFTFTTALDGATNASVIHTNVDVTAFRYFKLAGVHIDDEETAVTNLAVKYYKKRP